MTHRMVSFVALFAVAGASMLPLASCVSDNNSSPLAPSVDASLPGDSSLPTDFDANAPSADATSSADGASAADSTAPSSDASDGAPIDAETSDAPVVSSDAGTPDAPVAYTDAAAVSNWTPFNAASLDAGLYNFGGATYDGRYAYFAPYHGIPAYAGIVSRLDTKQDFTTPGAWTTFESSTVLNGSGAFAGTVFDGRYVYFVPFSNGLSTQPDSVDQTFVRYDTQGAGFTAGSAWEQFDGTSLVSGPFLGATFDGRFVYFAPDSYSSVAIYDTTLPFTSQSSWSTFDTSKLTPPPPTTGDTFSGAVFDGRYAYLLGTVVARVDSTTFADGGASAWETYTPLSGAGSYAGKFGGFDGRYLYMVNQGSDVVLQYDTKATFNAAASWTPFDVSTAGGGAGGYFGVNFDGRYVYFFPYNGTIVAIYDSAAPFNAKTSWTTFDTSTVQSIPSGYQASLFDGQYLYVVSSTNTQMLRFEVKTGPGALPSLPFWHGSFY